MELAVPPLLRSSYPLDNRQLQNLSNRLDNNIPVSNYLLFHFDHNRYSIYLHHIIYMQWNLFLIDQDCKYQVGIYTGMAVWYFLGKNVHQGSCYRCMSLNQRNSNILGGMLCSVFCHIHFGRYRQDNAEELKIRLNKTYLTDTDHQYLPMVNKAAINPSVHSIH